MCNQINHPHSHLSHLKKSNKYNHLIPPNHSLNYDHKPINLVSKLTKFKSSAFIFILIIQLKFINVHSQFISANDNLQVNLPLQRWEQFQKQLKLNQINSPSSQYTNPLTNNNLDNLFTINPIGVLPVSNDRPTVVLNTLPSGVNQQNTGSLLPSVNLQPNSIFINDNRFRDLNTDNRYISTSNPSNKYSSLDQDTRYTTNNAFLDSIKNRTGDQSANQPANLNPSHSNNVPTRTNLDNFKELNHNLTKNHYIELSKKFMNLTLSITDSQFRGFLKFVHELSGKINSDCMSTLISLFYGLRRQQSWALKFIDSTGFLPKGIIDGTFTSLGEYDQCLSIQIPGELVKRNKEKNPDVYGKYCLSKLHLTKYNLLTSQEKNRFHKLNNAKFRSASNSKLQPNGLLSDNFTGINWSVHDHLDDNEDDRAVNDKLAKDKWRSSRLDELDKFKYNGTIIQNTVFENVSRLGLDFFQHFNVFRIGICAPSTCTNSDINTFLNKVLNEYKVYAQVSSKCDSTILFQSSYQSKYSMIAFLILLSSTSMVALGTILDFLRNKQARCGVYPNQRLFGKLLRCWSIRTALYRLTKCNCEQQPELYPIHGLKVLLTIWLIWSSTYLFGVFYSILWLYKRLIVVKELPKQFWFQFVSNSWLISDAFFFLSGLLLVYAGNTILSKSNGKSRFFFYIIEKIIRLVPIIIGLFCFYLFILNYIYGPVLLDDTVRRQLVINCEHNWWKNLLFINNLDDPRNMCLPNTYFLSANVQLTLIFYPIVMIMNQKPKLASNLLLLIISIAILYLGFITYNSNLFGMIPADQMTNLDYINYHLQLTYFPTFAHLSSYSIGLLTGCFILNRPSLLKNVNKLINLLLWTFAIGLSLSSVVLPFFWNDTRPSRTESVLYMSLHRPVFVIGLALLTFFMINGNAKFLSRLLCSNFFIPLSRLSLSTYLVHLPVVYLKFYTAKSTVQWSNLDFLFSSVTIYFLSLLLGLLLFILFQNPIESIEKVIFDNSKGNNSSIFNYEQNYKSTMKSLSSTSIQKQCHCGLNSARLAAKVNLDFSSFGGLHKTSQKSQLNSIANQLNGSPEFSANSSTKSLDNYPDSSNFLVSNVISYNTNGIEVDALDKINKVDGLPLSRDNMAMNSSNVLNNYLNTNPKQMSNFAIQNKMGDYQIDSVQLPQLDKSNYTNYDKGTLDIQTSRLNQNSLNSNRPGFNNHIGNNVANEIRRRLEQIKQNTNKLNNLSLYRSEITNIEEENEEFDFYSTELTNDSYHQQPYINRHYPTTAADPNHNEDRNQADEDQSYHHNLTFKV